MLRGTYLLKKTLRLGEVDDDDADGPRKVDIILHAEAEPLQLFLSVSVVPHE